MGTIRVEGAAVVTKLLTYRQPPPSPSTGIHLPAYLKEYIIDCVYPNLSFLHNVFQFYNFATCEQLCVAVIARS